MTRSPLLSLAGRPGCSITSASILLPLVLELFRSVDDIHVGREKFHVPAVMHTHLYTHTTYTLLSASNLVFTST